ncbi:unnamed protein product [Psylliodes chrysocephalus]|uniref:Uncharacterized protein n=1 Tax=Psylliodes chrysocephalus TaxID=3402493 RepID=A0A9P0CKA4_9CUCU|nr:unnamed protein product [Psylliodes chrysocephala]
MQHLQKHQIVVMSKREIETEKSSNGDTEENANNIESEKYYDTWYIGRVIDIFEETNTIKIKFLKSDLDSYVWPKDDIQNGEKSYTKFESWSKMRSLYGYYFARQF